MSIQRVIFDMSTGTFRVSAAGVDAGGAEFSDLIFDGNQPPLRLAVTGFVTAPLIDHTNTANIFVTISSAVMPTVPAGRYPLFLTMFRQPIATTNPAYNGSNAAGYVTSPFGVQSATDTLGSGGGTVSVPNGGGALRFTGLGMSRDGPSAGSVYPSGPLCNFAVFKNSQ